jgi:glutamate carboxypeptidase
MAEPVSVERVLASALRRSDETEALVAELTRINSHTRNAAGCDRVADALITALSGLPLTRHERGAPSFGRHLLFETDAAKDAPAFVLVGHHDTVFPDGSFEGFRVVDGVAHGPGVLDMKGGLAMVVTALHALHECGRLARLPLVFVSVSDEEVGSPSSRALFTELATRARAGLVFEAGRAGDAIITSRRGSGHATLRAHGKAAHAGNARADGASAVLALSRAIDGIEGLNEQLSDASASVGLVQGGSARNTVPDSAVAEVDLRFGTPAVQHALIAALEEVALAAAASVRGTRIDVSVHVSRAPWAESAATRALAEEYGACQAAAGLGHGIAPTAGGGSDANTLAALGVPVIDGLGPRGSGFHTHAEQLQLGSLGPKTEALLRFLLSG